MSLNCGHKLFILRVIYECEAWWNDTDRGKLKNSEKIPLLVSAVRVVSVTA
jgi:hypothetical protein